MNLKKGVKNKMYNNYLQHYGILGMKWGVRRANLNTGNKSKIMTADEKKKASMKKDVKNRRTLSDADLKKKLERIKMEKQLKELTAEEISPGKKAVSEILSTSGKRIATTVVTGAVLYGVKAALSKEFSIKDFASYMTPKPKK